MDIVLLIFVISAISPEMMPRAIENVKATLRRSPQSRVFLRDYACGDLAAQRFDKKYRQKIDENFYVRGDGTVRAWVHVGGRDGCMRVRETCCMRGMRDVMIIGRIVHCLALLRGGVERHRWLHRHGRGHGASVLSCLRHHDALLGLDGGLHLEAVGDEHLVDVVVGQRGRLLLALGHMPPQPASHGDVLQRSLVWR